MGGNAVDTKAARVTPKKHELHEQRKSLRGWSRQLHERLAEVCEEEGKIVWWWPILRLLAKKP